MATARSETRQPAATVAIGGLVMAPVLSRLVRPTACGWIRSSKTEHAGKKR